MALLLPFLRESNMLAAIVDSGETHQALRDLNSTQTEGNVSAPATPALEIDEPLAVSTASGSVQSPSTDGDKQNGETKGAEQVVTPWDVQGAVVEGVQVRQ